MKKDAYYFPHFSNARNDAKLIKLRRVLGIEGYGLYFMLLEVLREQTEFKMPLDSIEDLAYEWHISKEKIASVVNDFGLFEIIEYTFFSPKLIFYLKPYIEKSERARLAARKRWDEVKNNANAYANALPEDSKSNASKGEESKVKKSKVSISIDFYQNQIECNSNSEFIAQYKAFFDILMVNNPTNEKLEGVLSMPKQVSYDSFCKLLAKSKEKKKKFSSLLPTMDNDPKYTKKKSLSLTLHTWLNRE